MKNAILILIPFLLVSFLVGCSSNNLPLSTTSPTLEAESFASSVSKSPNLTLTLIRNEDDVDSELLTVEELDGIYNGTINYPYYLNVLIDLNGESMPIREAILDKHITVEEFIAGIRTDARNGYCTESYASELGLTHFLYTYSNFEVAIFDDVWEAPNGESFLVRDIYIDKKGGFKSEAIARYYINSEGASVNYKREDWGLNFEVVSLTPTSLVVCVKQSGGQQLGQLQIDNIYTSIIGSSDFLKEDGGFSISPTDGLIEMNGSSELRFDWSSCLGELPSGEYTISFALHDIYDSNAIHPFMKNYTDRQVYAIQFEIP